MGMQLPTGYVPTDQSLSADVNKWGLSAYLAWMNAPQGEYSSLMQEDPSGVKYGEAVASRERQQYLDHKNNKTPFPTAQEAQKAQVEALKNKKGTGVVDPALAASGLENPTIKKNQDATQAKTLLGQ